MTTLASPEAGRAGGFGPLLRQVRDSGLLRPRRRRYALSIGVDVLAFAAVWSAVFLLGNTWWQLFLAAPAAVFTTRMIFIGHDVGHGQIARTQRINDTLGVVFGDLIVGLSSRWWIDKHTRHHAHPNQVGSDPDVGEGVIAWTTEQTAGRGRVLGWVSEQQARLYFPLLLLEAFHLRFASVRASRRPGELVLLTLHLVGYLGLLLVAMGAGKAAVFVLIHQALLGLHLGCAFAPNHKGMPMPEPGVRWDFLRRQVLTSRNVRGGRVVDWFLGGLNYQIEHHLFPSMPRSNLRRAQRLVREHCANVQVPYVEETLRASLAVTVRHLHAVGAVRRGARAARSSEPAPGGVG